MNSDRLQWMFEKKSGKQWRRTYFYTSLSAFVANLEREDSPVSANLQILNRRVQKDTARIRSLAGDLSDNHLTNGWTLQINDNWRVLAEIKIRTTGKTSQLIVQEFNSKADRWINRHYHHRLADALCIYYSRQIRQIKNNCFYEVIVGVNEALKDIINALEQIHDVI